MALKSYATLFKRNKHEAKDYGATNYTPPATWYFAFHFATTLTAGATATTNTISVNDPIAIGANIIVAPMFATATDLNAEQHVVQNISGSGPYTVTLVANLAHNHLTGAYVAFDPGDDCAQLLEHTGDNYSRASLVNNTTNFPAPSGAVTSSATQITWGTPSATWKLATHVVANDALSGGNAWDVGVLDSFQILDTGAPPKIVIGNFQPKSTKP